jgi:hypothetical protein
MMVFEKLDRLVKKVMKNYLYSRTVFECSNCDRGQMTKPCQMNVVLFDKESVDSKPCPLGRIPEWHKR